MGTIHRGKTLADIIGWTVPLSLATKMSFEFDIVVMCDIWSTWVIMHMVYFDIHILEWFSCVHWTGWDK